MMKRIPSILWAYGRPCLALFLLLVQGLLLPACQAPAEHSAAEKPIYRYPKADDATPLAAAPAWAADAIWYQVFVERFRNGDPANDPTRESLKGAYPEEVAPSWSPTPWTQEWYARDPWMADMADTSFYPNLQARRYGGDLQGVLDKLDYLQALGINAIYFNPLNDAPSLHKYDPAHYRHIDRHFGPNPQGDATLMAQENPADPGTWQWTSADELFLQVIEECHTRGIRVILDYSWNHTGRNFWAFQEVKQKGEASAYKDWYYIKQFNDPTTPEDEFEYQAWFGAKTLPELREDITNTVPEHVPGEQTRLEMLEGNLHSEALKQHIFAVSSRWLDPNGDGNPADGIDGFRLDVAAEIPMGFWEEYRAHVRSINPEAYLIGEVWWQLWPHELMDPKPFLGRAFDAVMNYRWYRVARGLFAQARPAVTPGTFFEKMDSLTGHLHPAHPYAMMNVASSHDSPRLSSSFANNGLYKHQTNPRDKEGYANGKPSPQVWQRMQLMLLHQFTWVGAPHIWNGEEMGMWGADDPDCRKPLWWPDYDFEPETRSWPGMHPSPQPVGFDSAVFAYYQQLAKLRRSHSVFRTGELYPVVLPAPASEQDAVCYRRKNETDEAVVLLLTNEQKSPASTALVKVSTPGIYVNALTGEKVASNDHDLTLPWPKPGTGSVWLREGKE